MGEGVNRPRRLLASNISMPRASLVHTGGADSQPTDSPLTCDPSEIFPARGARLPVSRPRRPNFLGGKSERQPRASQRLIFSFKRQEHSCGAVNVRHAAVAASSERALGNFRLCEPSRKEPSKRGKKMPQSECSTEHEREPRLEAEEERQIAWAAAVPCVCCPQRALAVFPCR